MGARESLDEEDIADLKLVVTEACTCFLWGLGRGPHSRSSASPATRPALRVDFVIWPGGWEITISTRAPSPHPRREAVRPDGAAVWA